MKREFAVLSACIALSLTACAAPDALEAQARCSDQVLSDRSEDAPKIVELAPGDSSEIKPESFNESHSLGYSAGCLIVNEEGVPVVSIDGWFAAPGDQLPSDAEQSRYFDQHLMHGSPHSITSPNSQVVAGVSGDGSASLSAPCTVPVGTVPDEFRKGDLVVTVLANDAPSADSMRQRQNAADLALSFLRHAVKSCEDPPRLPKSVKVRGS